MKIIWNLVFLWSISLLISDLPAQEKETIPLQGRRLVGSLVGSAIYNGQIALGRISRGQYNTLDEVKMALRDTGGMMGGTGALIKEMQDTRAQFPEDERLTFEEMIRANQLLKDQAELLIELLRAKHYNEGVAAAQAKFDKKRTEAGDLIAKLLGIDRKLVE